jgi:hypothetical protein
MQRNVIALCGIRDFHDALLLEEQVRNGVTTGQPIYS